MELKKNVAYVDDMQMLALTAMASDVRFTTEIGYQISPDVWEDDWARILAGWMTEHVMHYNTAPMAVLADMAHGRCDSVPDEDTAESICRFASKIPKFRDEHRSLFDDYKFLSDTTLKWIKRRNLEVLQMRLANALDSNNIVGAEGAVHAYSDIRRAEYESVDMMGDVSSIISAFDKDNTELFRMPGALGMMNGPFQRGDLLLVLGESGTGKSWMCLSIAHQALLEGLSVLYVNLEITKAQMIRRVYSCMTGRPVDERTVYVPRFVKEEGGRFDDDEDEPVRTWDAYKVVMRESIMSPPSLDRRDVADFLRTMRMSTDGGRFHIINEAAGVFGIRDLENRLDNMRLYHDFVPDLLIVDYGDLMRPASSKDEKRIQINDIYLGLRRIAKERDIMVVSPNQSNRGGYGRDMRKQDVAENIANVNHASLIWGLSHSPKEKEMGITRVKVLKNRDSREYADPAICIGCLDIGRLVMDSRMKKDVVNTDKE